MGNVAVVERVEEMGRWPAPMTPPMFEVPHVNAQNFNSANYADWGNMPFESRRRSARGAKPHHNSRRNHQQPAWAAECGPAPASPQWQPQPPPAVDTNFAGFQDPQPQGPVAVNLQGLPYALCRQNFLEAMLDQAGLADDIMGCVLGEDQDTGKAVIYLANYNAALKCVQHFGGRRWDHAGPPVTAQVAEGQSPPAASGPQARVAAARPRKSRGTKNGQDQLNMVPAAPGCAGYLAMPQPALPIMAVQELVKGSDLSPDTAGSNSPKGSTGSNSPKVCWADLADDDDTGKQISENDLSEGLEGSTSAGSTGCNSQNIMGESFFFGCDVDTDDGF